ncbi:MAG: hypothetical protein COV46_00105 [Deltaproteobacteria bacterium CG11_big_fil_rev_8_21_14_0_20_49_13]|nr:MAG: hypothetical protein COV46_00105 [Deltaproteobacteria bacterium CG11_big_fil_rev_8_21_14_0_20_49_13]
MDARLQHLTTPDKLRLYFELWIPNQPKAAIVFVHGLGDHIGRYAEFAKYLIGKNYALCMYDQRGHGRSGGRKAHCHSFNDYLRDLSQVVDMVHASAPGVPLFLIGHSFGGQVAINFVARYAKGVRGLVALSPNIEPLIKIPGWKKKLAGKISKVLPIIRFYTHAQPSHLSHDEQVVEASRSDPLMHWHVTARLGTEILKNLSGIHRLAYKVKVPSIFMHGSEDRICSIEGTRKFYFSLLVQNKEMKIYPGFYHELLHEVEREKVLVDIGNWLNNQIIAFKRIARADEEGHIYEKEAPDLWRHVNNDTVDHRT